MHPELFRIPIFDHPIKSYGAMLTLGFLSGVWLSIKRAERMKCDPDLVLNLGFVSLVCGVVGARIFYVAHYWESSFARQQHPIFAALNCTSGGLEYYGGLICAMLGCVGYIYFKRASIRMYIDLLAPAAIWGLAFGRMGCLLNGCCWGGLCVEPQYSPAEAQTTAAVARDDHAVVPWGITFPHHSPAQIRQWENRQLTLPAELLVTDEHHLTPIIVPLEALQLSPEKRAKLDERAREAAKEADTLKAEHADATKVNAAKERALAAIRKLDERGLRVLAEAQRWPSRNTTDPGEHMTSTALADLAYRYRSLPVHPVQIYGIINALLLSWVLLELLYRRKRHGVVFATLCTIYPITRIILETVRVDNPHDSAGLTISQAVSVGMFLVGVALFVYLWRAPQRSPLAVPYVPPPIEDA